MGKREEKKLEPAHIKNERGQTGEDSKRWQEDSQEDSQKGDEIVER